MTLIEIGVSETELQLSGPGIEPFVLPIDALVKDPNTPKRSIRYTAINMIDLAVHKFCNIVDNNFLMSQKSVGHFWFDRV